MVKYIKQGWLVLTLATVFGAALAGVHLGLKPLIEANKKRAILQRVPQMVIGYEAAEAAKVAGNISVKPDEGLVEVVVEGESARYEVSLPVTLDMGSSGEQYLVYQVRDENSNVLAYIARVKGLGFADVIELLVGFSDNGQVIRGLYVLDQKETPGVGNKIEFREFAGQFDNLPFADLMAENVDAETGATSGVKQIVKVVKGKADLSKKDGLIDAVSGATVSSKAVCDIVNRTIVACVENWAADKISGFKYPSDSEEK